MQEALPSTKRTALKEYLLQPKIQEKNIKVVANERIDWSELSRIFEELSEIVPSVELFAVIEAQILRDAEVVLEIEGKHLQWLRSPEAQQLKLSGKFYQELSDRLEVLQISTRDHSVKLRSYNLIRANFPQVVRSLRESNGVTFTKAA